MPNDAFQSKHCHLKTARWAINTFSFMNIDGRLFYLHVLLAICGVVSIVMFDFSEYRKWCFMYILLLRCMYSLYLQSTIDKFINIACVFYANIRNRKSYIFIMQFITLCNKCEYLCSENKELFNLTHYNNNSLPLVQF